MWCYIYTAAGAVPSGKRETSSYITPGVLFKGADANSLAALLHACPTVSRRWFKADDMRLASDRRRRYSDPGKVGMTGGCR